MKELKLLADSTVQMRNQIVIPKPAAERLKLKKGDKVGFFEVEGNSNMIIIARVNYVVTDDLEKD